MVKTGSILFIQTTGEGFDSSGDPKTPTNIVTDEIDANIRIVKSSYVLYSDGQTKQAQFTVVIESSKISSLTLENYKSVQLKDSKGNSLGTFQIQNIEYLDLTKKVKIIIQWSLN